jgi:hypothetical protein
VCILSISYIPFGSCFCVCIHSIYIKMDIYLLFNFIPLLHFCLIIIAYLIYSYSYILFANPYLFILMCDIFSFYSCRVCILNIYIYIYIYLYIYIYIYIYYLFYLYSCLSYPSILDPVSVSKSLGMYKYISNLFISICVLCICIFLYACLSNSIPYLNIVYV